MEEQATPLTPDEVASRWRVSRRRIVDLCRTGWLRAFKVGRSWRIPAAELERVRQGRQGEAA